MVYPSAWFGAGVLEVGDFFELPQNDGFITLAVFVVFMCVATPRGNAMVRAPSSLSERQREGGNGNRG